MYFNKPVPTVVQWYSDLGGVGTDVTNIKKRIFAELILVLFRYNPYRNYREISA